MRPFNSSVSSARFAASDSKLELRLARPAGPTRAAAVDGHGKLVEPVLVVGERERRLHVGRDLHGDVGARKPELHLQRKSLADAEILCRQAEVRELPAAARRRIVPNDVRVLDLDGTNAEIEIARAVARRRRPARPPAGAAPPPKSCQLLAPLRLRARLSSRPCSRAWLISMRWASSGNKPTRKLGAADARHRLVAEAGRIAQAGGADGDANRREQRELEVAVERELPARRVLHGGRDVVLVVVRVEQQADRDGHDDEQQNDDTDGNAQES